MPDTLIALASDTTTDGTNLAGLMIGATLIVLVVMGLADGIASRRNLKKRDKR